jgi:hypothetical protein
MQARKEHICFSGRHAVLSQKIAIRGQGRFPDFALTRNPLVPLPTWAAFPGKRVSQWPARLRHGPFVGYTVAETQCRILTGGFAGAKALAKTLDFPVPCLCFILFASLIYSVCCPFSRVQQFPLSKSEPYDSGIFIKNQEYFTFTIG